MESRKVSTFAAALLFAAGPCAFAHQPDPRVLPPNLAPMGKSYGEWGSTWWQWIMSIPASENPNLDPSGAFADRGQSGPVWFLGGTFGGSVTRTCTLPAGKALFLPLVNYEADIVGEDPPSPVEVLLARAAASMDKVTELHASIDGVPIQGLFTCRAASPKPFAAWLPAEDNLYQFFGVDIAGKIEPAITDGYWLMLAPLSVGKHTINFGGAMSTGFAVDMTYHITVDGGPSPYVLPPDLMVGGMSYGAWGSKWWQWAYSIPVADNPLFDETGAKAGTSQSGPVYFLAGVMNVSGTAERTITVPAGKALFFPMLNLATDNVDVDPPRTVQQLYDRAEFFVSKIIDLHASIDGNPVPNPFDYRGTSPAAFSYDLPATDNIYQFWGSDVSGKIEPAVSDGYWLMLAPLAPGEHRLNFGGTYGDPINFTLDITYHINVETGASEYVLPPESMVGGMSYGAWGSKWWQWAYSIPVADNPLFDETGAKAGSGQSGPVYFLAGVMNVSGTAERTIAVPAGKALFFPMLNLATDNVDVDPPRTVQQLYDRAAFFVSKVTDLHASIDGKPVANPFDYRGTSPEPFSFDLPATGNIYQFWGSDVSGKIEPAVSDGYWLMLAPLAPGEHEIRFGGTYGDPINFTLDITYHVTVLPEAAGLSPYVLPPNLMVGNMSYGAWGSKWWQWAYSIPVADNPLFDETGAKAGTGQSGPVYFLAGVMNVSGTAERTIAVPAGKALFFPMLNLATDNVDVDPPRTVQQLYDRADFFVSKITDLHASIDGNPVPNPFDYRGTSPEPFSYDLPATDNIYQFWGSNISGKIEPAVSDGYWLMLAPLAPGPHEIRFGGSYGDPINFTLNITYHVTVTPIEHPDLRAVQYRWRPWPSWRWDGFRFQGWMFAKFENAGLGDAFNVAAWVSKMPANNIAADPDIALGDILAGASAWSRDTFSMVTDLSKPADPKAGIAWSARYDDALGFRHVVEGIPQFPARRK